MSGLRLTEDFCWILEQCQDPDKVFEDSSTEKDFAWAWLLKLCTEVYSRKEEKQLRNLYLLELSKCIKEGMLNKLFRSLPPKAKLKPFESSLKIKIDPKTIIADMQAAAAELIPHVSPRNYQTHMSTKIFDDNQGACAYLAVSLGDPKDGPIWIEMGNKKPLIQTKPQDEYHLEGCDSCDYGNGNLDDCDEVNVEFLELCLQETAEEIAGQAEPGESALLEEQLALYEKFIREYDIGEEARHLTKSELRTFLLINFQTDLLHALERYKWRNIPFKNGQMFG